MKRAASLLDQVLSGLSNFITVALVARALEAPRFGSFVVGYALLTTALTLVRGRWGTQLSLSGSGVATLDLLRRLSGAGLVTAPALMLMIFLPAVIVTQGSSWAILLLVAAAGPVVCVQDLCRYAAIAVGRPGVAVASDSVWVLLVGTGWLLGVPAVPALLTWIGAAMLAMSVGLAGLRVKPRLRGAWATLRDRHATGEVLAAGMIAINVANFATLGFATLFIGSAAAGSLRGASTLMAPANTLFAFVSIALLPVLHARRRGDDLRFCTRLLPLVVLPPLMWGALLLALPEAAGRVLLGDTWTGARSVLVWTALEYALMGAAVAAQLGLQARESARSLLRIWTTYAGLLAVGGVLGASIAREAWVVAAGLAGSVAWVAAANWWVLLRESRTRLPVDRSAGPVVRAG